MTRPTRRPACGSPDLLSIIYGFPSPELQKNPPPKVVLGACTIDIDAPDYQCGWCGRGITADGRLVRGVEATAAERGLPRAGRDFGPVGRGPSVASSQAGKSISQA